MKSGQDRISKSSKSSKSKVLWAVLLVSSSAAVASGPTYIKPIYSPPLTLDPAQMNETSSLVVSQLIYDGLLSFSSDLQFRGQLAKSWTTSGDGKTLTFELRGGAKFHDQSEVTAKDVVNSFERLTAPSSKVYSYYDCIEGAPEHHEGKAPHLTGVRAIHPKKVEIRLRHSFPPFLSVLAGATAKVLPERAAADPKFFENPVGSGPFRWRGNDGKTDFILERFEGHTGGVSKISRLILKVMSEATAIESAQAGSVHDLANFPLSGSEKVFEIGQHIHATVSATWIIGLNARLAPFQEAGVRTAFRKSIDSEAFRLKFHPDAIPAQGYLPPGLPGYRAAGLTKKSEAVVSAKISSEPMIQIAIPEALSRAGEMKEFLEKQLNSKGWRVRVVALPWDQLMKGYTEKTLQAFLVSMNMDYPDPDFLVRNFESRNSDNFSGLNDPAIDGLIKKARETRDRRERHRIYGDLANRLKEASVTVDLFHPRGHIWLHPCVKGFEPNLLGDVYIDYTAVDIDGACEDLHKNKKGKS